MDFSKHVSVSLPLAVAATILTCQLIVPPVVGLADQGDFIRIIRPFGYGPEPSGVSLKYAYVPARYIPDSGYRARDWEQPTSESLPIAAALLLNRLISRDGSLNVEVVGFTHAVLFLAAFASLLSAIRGIYGGIILAAVATLMLTDVGYAAYWSSLYREPAACLCLLLLLSETIRFCRRGQASAGSYARSLLWAILLIAAKPQYAPLAIPLAIFSMQIALGSQFAGGAQGMVPLLGAVAILGAGAISLVTVPAAERRAATYNLIFHAVLPESKDPAADLRALGLDAGFARFSNTDAWSEGTGFYQPEVYAAIGTRVTQLTVARFYVMHPSRLWRHVRTLLPVAGSLRPEFCGNFELSAGYPPGARGHTFSVWSSFHERVLPVFLKPLLFLFVMVSSLAILPSVSRLPRAVHRWAKFSSLLASCCLIAFLAAAFGDALDNVKHMFLFNLLVDACVVTALAFALSAGRVFLGISPKRLALSGNSDLMRYRLGVPPQRPGR